jgi:DNA repair protein RadC
MIAASIDAPTYEVGSDDDTIIAKAMSILYKRMSTFGVEFSKPAVTKQFCCLKIGNLQHEVFGVIFLNSQHQLISFEEMFRGTLTQTSVYPREIVKAALQHNAAAVIFTHNHPSGSLAPSRADELLTRELKTALTLIDVRVLDHIIVSGDRSLSMAEMGLV